VRCDSNSKLQDSAPCQNCLTTILELNIKRIVFSYKDNTFISCNPKELTINHISAGNNFIKRLETNISTHNNTNISTHNNTNISTHNNTNISTHNNTNINTHKNKNKTTSTHKNKNKTTSTHKNKNKNKNKIITISTQLL
jgi:hypothetical protein